MNCIICNKELQGNQRKYCSKSCYYADWYRRNKDKISNKRKQKYNAHPRPKLTEEEKKQRSKERMEKYIKTHKEIIKKRHHDYYEKHKNDEQYKERIKKNLRAYYERHKKR